MANLNGIEYTELAEGSGVMHWGDPEQTYATRRLRCAWADSVNLVRALRGYAEASPDGTIVIYRPQPHPEIGWLYVSEVARRPSGKPVGLGQWTSAILDVTYKPALFGFTPEDFFNESLEIVSSYEEIPRERIVWDGTNEHPDYDQKVLVTYGRYRLRIERMPRKPVETIATYVGKVNSKPFMRVPAGHLLLEGAAFTRTVGTGGTEWTTEFMFLWSPTFDLRKRYDPKTNAWRLIKVAGGQDVYQAVDFNSMIQVR